MTVRLSRLFHERLGDEVADEIANWFNQVDTTYRTDLRELNEHNFARFDAKVEQRAAESEARLGQRMADLEVKLVRQMSELRAELLGALADTRSRLIAWMFGLWITSALGLATIVFTILQTR